MSTSLHRLFAILLVLGLTADMTAAAVPSQGQSFTEEAVVEPLPVAWAPAIDDPEVSAIVRRAGNPQSQDPLYELFVRQGDILKAKDIGQDPDRLKLWDAVRAGGWDAGAVAQRTGLDEGRLRSIAAGILAHATERLGARLNDPERMSARLRDLRTTLLRFSPDDFKDADLSAREVQVLMIFLKTGWSYQRIAELMLLARHTVANHIYAVRVKLGVIRRADVLEYGASEVETILEFSRLCLADPARELKRTGDWARQVITAGLGPVGRLSSTERAVLLNLLATDWTKEEIAEFMKIKVSTVKNHLHNVGIKLEGGPLGSAA